MIIFDGYLSGNANEFYIKKMMNAGSKLLLILIALSIPMWVLLSIITDTFIEVMVAVLVFFILSPLVFHVCITKKEKQRINLKKVSICDGEIKAISEKTTIRNPISKVKAVNDYGEFYEVVFPSIYITAIYVCQKNLISKGSIEEFEAVFSDKIVRINK